MGLSSRGARQPDLSRLTGKSRSAGAASYAHCHRRGEGGEGSPHPSPSQPSRLRAEHQHWPRGPQCGREGWGATTSDTRIGWRCAHAPCS